MTLLIFKQAKIENESEPKVISLGDFAVNVEEITVIHSIVDRYDCVVKNITGIRTRQGEGYYAIGNFKEIMEIIEQTKII